MKTARFYITGNIDNEKLQEFLEWLHEIGDSRNITRRIILSSDGGDNEASLAFYDVIKNYNSHNIPIEVFGIGLVASAAVLILAAGSKRVLGPNSWVMIHEETPGGGYFKGANVSTIERSAKHLRRLEDQAYQILESVTRTPAEEWQELHEKETFLSAKECVKLGLVDEILEG